MNAYYKIKNHIFEIGYNKKIESIKIVKKINEDNKKSEISNKAYKELCLYFDGKLKNFTFPISLKGSDFQKRVWDKIEKIPYGKTISYKDIGNALDSKAYQAIGSACGKNPILIRIPCHRVLSTNGIGGFSCGIDIKKELLKLENSYN